MCSFHVRVSFAVADPFFSLQVPRVSVSPVPLRVRFALAAACSLWLVPQVSVSPPVPCMSVQPQLVLVSRGWSLVCPFHPWSPACLFRPGWLVLVSRGWSLLSPFRIWSPACPFCPGRSLFLADVSVSPVIPCMFVLPLVPCVSKINNFALAGPCFSRLVPRVSVLHLVPCVSVLPWPVLVSRGWSLVCLFHLWSPARPFRLGPLRARFVLASPCFWQLVARVSVSPCVSNSTWLVLVSRGWSLVCLFHPA